MTKDEEKSQQIERLMTKDEEKSQQIERLMTTVQDQSQQIEMLKNVTTTHALYVWKIPNIRAILDRFRDVRVKNEDILSEPFYLSEKGYKLRTILKPNNWSVIKKKPHFVLFFRVVPGEFDPLLSWPFNETFRVTLIDQNPCKDKRKDISHVIDFSECLSTCHRPPRPPYEKGDKFDNFCGLCVNQDELQTGSYIINDAIFIMANKEWRA